MRNSIVVFLSITHIGFAALPIFQLNLGYNETAGPGIVDAYSSTSIDRKYGSGVSRLLGIFPDEIQLSMAVTERYALSLATGFPQPLRLHDYDPWSWAGLTVYTGNRFFTIVSIEGGFEFNSGVKGLRVTSRCGQEWNIGSNWTLSPILEFGSILNDREVSNQTKILDYLRFPVIIRYAKLDYLDIRIGNTIIAHYAGDRHSVNMGPDYSISIGYKF